jgi:hypothetical protein
MRFTASGALVAMKLRAMNLSTKLKKLSVLWHASVLEDRYHVDT